MTVPPMIRLVRPVDPAHVTILTEGIRKSSSQFVMLAGLVKDEDVLIETMKEADCVLNVEI